MSRCPSCFQPQANDALCATCAARARSDLALPLGATLREGRYRIGRTLGDPGGFGVTYLAWDASLERLVAIKEFFPRHITSRARGQLQAQPMGATAGADFDAGLQGFLNEARRLAKLDHANIVKVHDYCEANGTGYLVMSYYDGRDLADHARASGGRLGWQEALGLVLPLLDGLAEVHRAGLIHRDIKPANVYLATTPDGKWRPILIDFGAARWATTTHELTAILTEGFAPLEQYPGCGPQGPYTDVYAAAATLYAVVSRTVPASAPSRLTGTYVAHLTDLVPGVPRRLGDALEQALAVQSDERPQTAGELARLLRAAEGSTATRPRAAHAGASTADRAAAMADRTAATSLVDAPRPESEPAPTRPEAPTSAAPRATRSRTPVLLGGSVLVAVLVGSIYLIATGGGGRSAATPDAVSPSPLKSRPSRPSAPAAAEARRLFAAATAATDSGRWTAAMDALSRSRALLGEPGVARETSVTLRQLIDSVAAAILDACPADRSMLLNRGDKPPPCPVRKW